MFCPLGERDISHYYYGMCNRGLWPLMHFMTASCHFSTLNWRYYEAVNRNFAAAAASEAGDDDVVWVQDFHLALVPRLLREQRPRVPIGLFWHVPFPPEQIFRVFPWRTELLEGMLGADLVGFHTRSYVIQFLNCCERILGLRVDRTRDEVATHRGPVRVGVFPLGIPADYFAGLAASPRVRIAPSAFAVPCARRTSCSGSTASTTPRASSSACSVSSDFSRPIRPTIGASRWC